VLTIFFFFFGIPGSVEEFNKFIIFRSNRSGVQIIQVPSTIQFSHMVDSLTLGSTIYMRLI
jgi:hypothetical protein